MTTNTALVLTLVLTALLSTCPIGVDSASSGDYAPPGSGTWIINATTVVEDDADIVGDVEVYADLTISQAVLTHTAQVSAQWTVASGVALTIDNSTLTVPQGASSYWTLDLAAGPGSLTISDSLIAVGNTAHGFTVAAQTVSVTGSVFLHGTDPEVRLDLDKDQEDGHSLTVEAHSDNATAAETSSVIITNSVFRVATTFGAGKDCDGHHEESFCAAVEALDMDSHAKAGSLRIHGRSSVVLSGLTLLADDPLKVSSGDDELVFGELVLESSALTSAKLTNLGSIAASGLDVYERLQVRRDNDLDEDLAEPTSLNVTASSFATESCSSLKLSDEGIVGTVSTTAFANPTVTGFGDDDDEKKKKRRNRNSRDRRDDDDDSDDDSDDDDSDDEHDSDDDDDDDDDDEYIHPEDYLTFNEDGSASLKGCYIYQHHGFSEADEDESDEVVEFCDLEFSMDYCDGNRNRILRAVFAGLVGVGAIAGVIFAVRRYRRKAASDPAVVAAKSSDGGYQAFAGEKAESLYPTV